ncbi:putative serine protease HhoB precursor [Enhygromyxa salina]|uniref:Putative serine protease HhoB n=1 Tax=Enhygromyxa salina TaxID=215803 RepID=A0A2S9YER0_9BACT|nr:trypsin-like peptidase domain-containing protein [Enhygromyxa salina]PRQ03511.1 putative serine protease HhoB precursor [Enhygromyxa salina]
MPSPRLAGHCQYHVLLALLVLALGVGCREIEDPAPIDEPVRRDQSPLEVDTAPTRTQVTLPDFARVAQRVGPSVVSVISTVEVGSGRMRGIGSGMILSVQGEILTNEHVVRDAAAIKVLLPDDTQVEATVVVADPLFDLAVLQLEGEFSTLAPVRFRGVERPPMPGEWIMAIGQPFGLGDTVTVGVISGLGRDHADLGRPPDLDPEGIWSFIQTDASINIGNSGGPLVDLDGRVLGITTAVRQDGQGLAFAIPSAMALEFIDEVRTYRRMRHTRLGIQARNDNEFDGLPSAVRVTRVDPDGPGDRASLAVDDVILKIDGKAISRVSEVAYLTQLAGVGAEVTLTIRRGATQRTEQVVIIPEIGS